MSPVMHTCLDCGRVCRESRCPEHALAYQRARDARRGTPKQRGYDKHYFRVRKAMLAASPGALCAWCHRRPATTVDHVVPLAHGGTSDPDNLILACSECNSSRGSRTAPSPWTRFDV